MTAVALQDFPLSQTTVVAGADLSAYPQGTINYLVSRGLVRINSTTRVAKPFTLGGVSYVYGDLGPATTVKRDAQLRRAGYVVSWHIGHTLTTPGTTEIAKAV